MRVTRQFVLSFIKINQGAAQNQEIYEFFHMRRQLDWEVVDIGRMASHKLLNSKGFPALRG